MINLSNWIPFVSWIVGSLFLGYFLQFLVKSIAKSKKFKSDEDEVIGFRSISKVLFVSISRPIPFLFLVIGLRISFGTLAFDKTLINLQLVNLISDVLSVLFIISIGFFVYSLIDVVDHILINLTKKTSTTLDDMVAPMVRKTLRVAIVILVLVQIAQVLSDKPITSILAGLGVGGLAVALAAQDAIKNFFGSLIIFTDKPFELGERICVGEYDGFVEEVGFRSTRIRTLDGHVVTIPNGELASQMIKNIDKRPYIKRVVEIGITYDTSGEKTEQALDIISNILKDHEGQNKDFPPKVYFKDFNSSSLDLIAIYWYHPANYWAYMEHAEKVNLEILNQFNDAGIEFAFPTRTLYINQSE